MCLAQHVFMFSCKFYCCLSFQNSAIKRMSAFVSEPIATNPLNESLFVTFIAWQNILVYGRICLLSVDCSYLVAP